MLETRELLCFLTIARTSERGGDVIHKGLLFWRTFIRCCTGIISRAGLSYWFPDLQQIKTFVSHYHLCTEKCKEKLNDIFDIWTKKKKKKVKCVLWKEPHHRSKKEETGAAAPAQQLSTCRSFLRQTSQQECSAEISHCQCSMSMAWSQC